MLIYVEGDLVVLYDTQGIILSITKSNTMLDPEAVLTTTPSTYNYIQNRINEALDMEPNDFNDFI